MRAGHCTGCDRSLFRTIERPADDPADPTPVVVTLWPEPDALFAVVSVPPDGTIPGIAYCPRCAPPVGTPAPAAVRAQVPAAGGIGGYARARERHPETVRPDFRVFLEEWIPRVCKQDPAPWLAEWDADQRVTLMEAAHG